MKEGITYLDGFSGYGGFCLGLMQAGVKFKKVHFSEIDKHAIANYSYNFPNHEHVGSIKDVSKSTIGNIDLFTFGWPCQDNSIAGKRKGQSGGTRSGLLHEAVRVLNECKPRNFIAENVLGLLSVNAGIDFVQSLELLAYLGEECPQYDIEMQLLNTRWVLPQNRERLFFVGHLRGSGSRQIFPIGEDHCRNVKGGTTIGSGLSTFKSFQGNDIMPTIRSSGHGTLTNRHAHSIIRVQSATISGFEVAKEGDSINFSVPGSKTRRGRVGKGVAQTLETSCSQAVIGRMCGRHLVDGKRKDILGAPTDQRLEINEGGVSNCLSTVQKDNLVVTNRIRRLTPIECERLQGLPDNWTQYGLYDGAVKEISDTQRYKLCGNGVSVPIIKLIAERLYPFSSLTNT